VAAEAQAAGKGLRRDLGHAAPAARGGRLGTVGAGGDQL
jgi:hypothetical protein